MHSEQMPSLPSSMLCERAILGSCLLDNSLFEEASEILVADDFFLRGHRVIFEHMSELRESSGAIDIVALTDALDSSKELEAIGGVGYLSSLIDGLPDRPSVKQYVSSVREKAIARALINHSQNAISETVEQGEDAGSALERLQNNLFSLAEKRITQGFSDMPSIMRDSFGSLDNLYSRGREVTGIETGYTELDALTGGLQKKDLIIIAARPSMGKTALAMNITEHAAIVNEKTVGVFSLEMSKEALFLRMMASHAQVDSASLRNGYLSKDDMYKLERALDKLVNAQIFIDDSASISISEMRAKARRLKQRQGLDLLIVDYLQLMSGTTSKRYEGRQQEVSQISRGLKALAKDLDCPVVALSQLSRAPETRGDAARRPILSDLRESGSIEQDADVVAFIFREEVYKKDDPDLEGIAELIVAKQRNGPTDVIKLAFLKRSTRFENLSR